MAAVVFSDHARRRAKEMQVDLQDIAAMLNAPGGTVRPSRSDKAASDAMLATHDKWPRLAVVFYPYDGNGPLEILTVASVVWREYSDYVRDGENYVVENPKAERKNRPPRHTQPRTSGYYKRKKKKNG